MTSGCGARSELAGDASSRVSLARPAGGRGAHQQFVRALTIPQRAVVVDHFRQRNGPSWTVTLGNNGAPDDVDAIRGIVRRATNEARLGRSVELTEGTAIGEAEAFLTRNADLLGFTAADVAALDMTAGPARTTTYGAWVVQVRGRAPMRGYDGFESVAASVDLLLYLGEDGKTRYFVNLSRVHPHLVLDTTPLLGPDDDRVVRNVVGRPLFVAVDDAARPNARVRELRRIALGPAEKDDVRGVFLTIHVSPAPRGAYVSYWLAYVVEVVRRGQGFRFVVDADSGDLLEDAAVPVVPATDVPDPP